MKFKVKKHVTLPLKKITPNGAPAYVRFEGQMHLGEKVDDKKEAATLAHIIDLETGQEMEIICPFLLRKHLETTYPDHSYVGKQFEIRLTRDPEKKYNRVGLTEIEVDADDIAQMQAAEFTDADNSSNVQLPAQGATVTPSAQPAPQKPAKQASKGGKRK